MTLDQQYKYAVDARDKLTDNYYKWMSYYYLANAAILVAVTQLAKNGDENAMLTLSFIGVFVCFLWHLSCKGYYYWSNSWIKIIIRIEKLLLATTYHKNASGVYSVFSIEVKTADKPCNILIPNRAANISTPKLTLIFSYLSISCWLLYGCYKFYYTDIIALSKTYRILIISIGVPAIKLLPLLIRNTVKSLPDDDYHDLV